MTEIATSIEPDRASGRLHHAVAFVEVGLGLLATAVLMFVGVVVYGGMVLVNAWAYNYPRLEPTVLITLSILWLPVVLLEWRSLLAISTWSERMTHPDPVHVATAQPRRNLFFGAAVAVWWLAHAAAAVWLAHGFVGLIRFYNPDALERAVLYVVPPIVLFCAALATNIHLLIAAFALTRSQRLVRWMWRLRLIFDLAVAVFLHSFALQFDT